MISCQLQGGIANQILQLSGAFALARRNGFDYGFDFSGCHTPLQGFPANKYKDTVFKNIPQIEDYPFKYHYQEPRFRFDPLPNKDDMLIVNSYLQSTKYWEGFEEEVKNLFDLSPLMPEYRELSIVHVRRGDFLKSPGVYNILPVDYFKEAMEVIGNKMFMFVSDDMEWVRENFKGPNIFYSPFSDEIDDLCLIKYAKNVIASNSTFSLIGGIFNPNKDAKKIAPGKNYPWFTSKDLDDSDLVPEDWIRL